MFLVRRKRSIGRERRDIILKLQTKKRREETKGTSEGYSAELHVVSVSREHPIISLMYWLGATALRAARNLLLRRLRRDTRGFPPGILFATADKNRENILLAHTCLAHGTRRMLRVQPPIQARPAIQMPALRQNWILHRVETYAA